MRRHPSPFPPRRPRSLQGRRNALPVPPFSFPTHLQLELASGRPPECYIHRPHSQDHPYESYAAKLERVKNFILLPLTLEHVLGFGTLACLDDWLYVFTILPLKFFRALYLLVASWLEEFQAKFTRRFRFAELKWPTLGQAKRTRRGSVADRLQRPSSASPSAKAEQQTENARLRKQSTNGRTSRSSHRPLSSSLLTEAKINIIKGFLIIITCFVLMKFDASMAYHHIRGQSAIKLYVIFNLLEVADRLLSAIGQDILECLFSSDSLEHSSRSPPTVFSRPVWLFLVALVYTLIHSIILFYQITSLNVAVNSYSNALSTLLLSNQFVEIKSTVFKRIERENLFQLTCADIVERFQLWMMLVVIGSRNIVETGTFDFVGGFFSLGADAAITSNTGQKVNVPRSSNIMPKSFTVLPSCVFASLSKINSFLPYLAHVLGPFLVVLGSEMLVDWLKHSFVNKFNNNRPRVYKRFLDILARDYYTNAFGNQNLTQRLGLPVIPLACTFFRVSLQTYQMFLATWLPPTSEAAYNLSSTTSLAPQTLATTFQGYASPIRDEAGLSNVHKLQSFLVFVWQFTQVSARTLIAKATPSPSYYASIFTVFFFLSLYIMLLFAKLSLGMLLMSYSYARYEPIKARENAEKDHIARQEQLRSQNPQETVHQEPSIEEVNAPSDHIEGARRVGLYGHVELDEQKRKIIRSDDAGVPAPPPPPPSHKDGKATGDGNLAHIRRYEMAAKRIW